MPSPARARLNIEDQIRNAYYTPSPQSYDPQVSLTRKEVSVGGKISNARMPSLLDQPAQQIAGVPGPGAYVPQGTGYSLPEGGRLSKKPQARLQLDEYPVPAPGAYSLPERDDNPTRPRQLQGRFSREPRVTKFIQVEQRRGKQQPGPSSYDVQDAMDSVKPLLPEGGRWGPVGKPSGYFDCATKLVEDHPSPGVYNLPGDLQTKEVGKVVYKYESATMQETKELLKQVCGDRKAVPGPGAYTIPEPSTTASAPELRGREQGPALPYPFSYNCGSNHTRSFSNLAPVRQQNSADQIFGTGVRRGATNSRGPKRDAGTLPLDVVADHLEPDHLPSGVGKPLDEQSEDGEVQWRCGGFGSVRKSKSSSLSKGPSSREHPSIEEARKFYPSLSRAHGRQTGRSHQSKSEKEAMRLQRGKLQLAAVVDSLTAATSAALEPLDEDRLKGDAVLSLQDKARERMRLEGRSMKQQEAVLSEMLGVLTET